MTTDLTSLEDPRDAAKSPVGGAGTRVVRSSFGRYLVRKIGVALASIVFTMVVGFVIFAKMPADPVASLTRGRPTSPAQLA